jgi:SAM-dependent methyltransferase
MTRYSKSYLLNDPDDLKSESARLAIQARTLFGIESKVLFLHLNKKSTSIVDIGCGNGSFIKMVGEGLSASKLIGVDRNEALLRQAQDENSGIEFYKIDLSDHQRLGQLLKSTQPESLICRFVIQHLSEGQQNELLRLIKENKPASSRLILADSDDGFLSFHPRDEALSELVERKNLKQKNEGGDRNVGSRLGSLLKDNKFESILENRVTFSHDQLGWDVWEAIAWPVISEGISKSPIDSDKELLQRGADWFRRSKIDNQYKASFSIFYASGI